MSIAEEFAKSVLEEFSPIEILLYGSYAKGTAREESDIDIAVVFDELGDDWLKNESKLTGIAWKTNYNIEAVALEDKNDRSGFLEHIRGYAIPVYLSTPIKPY